jgi:hypothetical protein
MPLSLDPSYTLPSGCRCSLALVLTGDYLVLTGDYLLHRGVELGSLSSSQLKIYIFNWKKILRLSSTSKKNLKITAFLVVLNKRRRD